ncbi:MAG: DNA-3-methyladenine glycosylase [Imperialibacter sp.]|uniref:DNA-3-methyladenine glycosylase n=1 Tax=Imperialibacter sp. TaxID=2038411 RepID=UPI0032EFC4B6
MPAKPLSKDFYVGNDVVPVAKNLLGRVLCTFFDGELTAGMIVETEAYSGVNDMACHACRFGKTSRTEVMFQEGGVAYVYLCYGIHHMVNVVTNVEGNADAVLIRAVEPLEGAQKMMERRRKTSLKRISAGPGTVGEALGIKVANTGESLLGPSIWLEERGIVVTEKEIVATTRIGVDYAGEDALKPWRFYIKDNPFISRK